MGQNRNIMPNIVARNCPMTKDMKYANMLPKNATLNPSNNELNLSLGVKPRYVTYWSPVGANLDAFGTICCSSLIGIGMRDMLS